MRQHTRIAVLKSVLAAIVLTSAARGADPPAATLVADYLPSNTALAIAIRPAELATSKLAESTVAAFDQLFQPTKLGISVADIEYFKLVMVMDADNQGPEHYYFVLRSKQPYDWRKYLANSWAQIQPSDEANGRQLFTLGSERHLMWLVDDRTVVFGSAEAMQPALEPADESEPVWGTLWKDAVKSPAAGLLKTSIFSGGGIEPVDILGGKADYGVVRFDVAADGLKGEAVVNAIEEDDAATVAKAASEAIRDLATEIATALAGEMKLDDVERGSLVEHLAAYVGGMKVTVDGKQIKISGLATPAVIEGFAGTMLSAVRKQNAKERM